jgi:exosortase A
VRTIVQVWMSSETYTHGFLVFPATLWLVWQRRAALAALPIHPFWPGLLLVAGGTALWLVGELSSAAAPTHFAVVGISVGAVITLFGIDWARALAFPLLFLFFAVPFGEAFVPVLIGWTADFTVAALQWTGVPVFREGNLLTIPTGRWSVVEACSGVRYLIASLVTGALYAWLMYRSPRRRLLFIVASIVVPIVANWMRAYLIVMLGHLSGNRIAAGVDHLIYGWFFFGVIMFLMFAVGMRWYEETGVAPRSAAARLPQPQLRAVLPAVTVVMVAIAAGPLARVLLDRFVDTRPVIQEPIRGAGGWREVGEAVADWQPDLAGPRALTRQSFERDGRRVTVYLGMYRNQQAGSELVSSQNRLLPIKERYWTEVGAGLRNIQYPGGRLEVATSVLRSQRHLIRVWRGYWLGQQLTVSDARAKLDLALDRLLLRSDTSAWVALATEHDAQHPGRSDALLDEFASSMWPAVEAALVATARR